jgi:hypothetical protein
MVMSKKTVFKGAQGVEASGLVQSQGDEASGLVLSYHR